MCNEVFPRRVAGIGQLVRCLECTEICGEQPCMPALSSYRYYDVTVYAPGCRIRDYDGLAERHETLRDNGVVISLELVIGIKSSWVK